MTTSTPTRDDDLVAEPNESQSSRSTGDARPAHPDPARTNSAQEPEVVEAEVVEESTTGGIAGHSGSSGSRGTSGSGAGPDPQDDEEFRQYQQFLEFQKFQEWQRRHGGSSDTSGTSPESRRPRSRWWYYTKRVLRFKPVRRLLYLVGVLLLLLAVVNYYFGGSEDSSSHTGTPGNQDPGLSPALSSNPQLASVALYHYLASPSPEVACHLLSQPAQQAFAGANGAPDCTAATHRIHEQVTNPSAYGNPDFGEDAIQQVNNEALVDSCKLTVQGGPRLGKFRLQRQYNGGWLIDRYAGPTC